MGERNVKVGIEVFHLILTSKKVEKKNKIQAFHVVAFAMLTAE